MMKLMKFAAKYTSAFIGTLALVFVAIEKIPIGDKEIPASLRK